MRRTHFLSLALLGSFMLGSGSSLSLRDPNTCASQKTFTSIRNITVKQPYTAKSYEWCLHVPPRCTIHRTEWRNVIETKVIPITRTAIGCCPGYNLNAENICAPVCTGGCSSGSCIAPEYCTNSLSTSTVDVTLKKSREHSNTIETSTTSASPIESDHLQIEDTLLTEHLNGITENNDESMNFSTKPTPLFVSVIPVPDSSTEPSKQLYNLTSSTTSPYSETASNALKKPSISSTTEITKLAQEDDSLQFIKQRNKHGNLNSSVEINVVDKHPDDIDHSTHIPDVEDQFNAKEERSIGNDSDIIHRVVTTNVTEVIAANPISGESSSYGNANNASVWRDPLKYRTYTENNKQNNETTYSKPQQMNLSDRFIYSIGISIGIMFAIIMVTLVITKHQHYLQEVDPRCGNRRNSEKCKAAHKTDEQDTTLHVVHYQVTRETINTPTIECETTCINSTRNSTITVYNFPPPSNAIDLPFCPPIRPFGDYDFPSPMAENVYDEIPARRDARDGFRCFARE